MMVRKIIGWVLILWGIGGLIANLVFVILHDTMPVILAVNSVVCLLFIWGGWKLSHPKIGSGGQVRWH